MPETSDDSERRDWDLPPMDGGGAEAQEEAPGTTTPLDRPSDDAVADDTERRDWDLP